MDFLPTSIIARKTLVPSTPGAGVDWSFTVPSEPEFAGAAGILVKSVVAVLTQGSTQTPAPVLEILDPAGTLIAAVPGATGPAAVSTTTRYCWTPGGHPMAITGSGANCYATAPLPLDIECLLPVSYVIGTVSAGIGTNSQWGSLAIHAVLLG